MTNKTEDKFSKLRSVDNDASLRDRLMGQVTDLNNRGHTMPDFSDAGTEPFIIGSTVYHMEFNGTLHEFEGTLVHKETKDRGTYGHQMFETSKSAAIQMCLTDMEEMRENIVIQLGALDSGLLTLRDQLKRALRLEGKPSLVENKDEN